MTIVTNGQNLLLERYPLSETPKTKPISDQQIKDHLLVSHNSDDVLIDTLAWAAIEEVENRGSVALIYQTRRQYLGGDMEVAKEAIAITHLPVASVTGVYYIDSNGVQQTLATSKYRVTQKGVYFPDILPSMAVGPDKLWIDYLAGYGSTAASVPAAWQHCIMYLTMHKYELRGEDPGKNSEQWQKALDRLIVAAGANLRGY